MTCLGDSSQNTLHSFKLLLKSIGVLSVSSLLPFFQEAQRPKGEDAEAARSSGPRLNLKPLLLPNRLNRQKRNLEVLRFESF